MNKKIKVLQINAYYGDGSTGNIVKLIEEEGMKNGIEMYSIYWLLPKKSISKNVIYCGNRKNKCGVQKISQWILRGGKLDYNTEITKRIVRQIKQINPDIIHIHNLHGDFEYGTLNISLLFCEIEKMKKKVIWTLHDCLPITGRCYHFAYKNCNKWKDGCGKCPQRLFDREGIFKDYSHLNWIKKKQLYKKIDLTIVTVSEWLHRVASESILKDKDIITIYNGINCEVFKPQEDDKKKNKFTILCIGWDRRKGYKDYYKLSKLLKEDEQIIVVGNRPIFRKWRKLPRNIIEKKAANNSIMMRDYYCISDVYFNASQAETFGLTTVEAMSCNIPVVGYDSTATPELIYQIRNGGYVVKKGDVHMIYNKVKGIRNDKVIRNLHKQCTLKFSQEKMQQEYIKLYYRLL